MAFQVGLQPFLGDFHCLGALIFKQTCNEFGTLQAYFIAKDGLFTCYTRDRQLSNESSEQFSVISRCINIFDSKTVIYCPLPFNTEIIDISS